MTPGDWQPIIEGLLESVWLVDPVTLRILGVNTAAGQLIGLDPADLVDKPVIELTATPEDQFFWEDVAAGLSSGIHSETLLRGADGIAVPGLCAGGLEGRAFDHRQRARGGVRGVRRTRVRRLVPRLHLLLADVQEGRLGCFQDRLRDL